ncbi:DUF3180 domain-containing protein [Segniliparus rugosus]|uniref:Uncharacterized protein n=1 Tax=Segniliparus rugosus (strain ATCC BAA-974 / DSM 45345 / CCUG 50838 / CIP 108380 / JCM 13579 / CDC 945) TaxID=679197 RepID=E5XQX9_SEGRC|nr:DUF3180 domain-containing protein [Segniliparus rugosus]EFV13219.2 hypothetical protein HMPREF9336_01881 [Segniliparus rugosus ATCC BAA-974]
MTRSVLRIGLVECAGCALAGALFAMCWPHLRTMPTPLGSGAPLLVAGLMEAGLGSYLKTRVQNNRIGLGPNLVPPVFVARAGALASASALAGMFGLGFWGALGVHAFLHKSQLFAAERNFPGDIVGAVCAAALVAGAFWLRRCCRAPGGGEGDPGEGGSGGRAS